MDIENNMLLYKDYISFKVLSSEVNLINQQYSDYSNNDCSNVVAEINDKYYYLGSKSPNLITAILAYEYHSDYKLTDEELDKCFEANGF